MLVGLFIPSSEKSVVIASGIDRCLINAIEIGLIAIRIGTWTSLSI